MTLEGVALKSLALLVLAVAAGAFSWYYLPAYLTESGVWLLWVTLALTVVIGFVTVIKKTWSPITAPFYAIAEGLLLGFISYVYDATFDGIVLQAILLTGGIFVAMLLLYLFRIIKVTENFRLGIAAATGGIALFYLAHLFLGIFGIEVPLVASTSGWGIGFTLVVIVIAALNLVVDFDFIEKGVEQQAPKYMEWYASFGLLVTLIWLYLEILRLLAKLQKR